MIWILETAYNLLFLFMYQELHVPYPLFFVICHSCISCPYSTSQLHIVDSFLSQVFVVTFKVNVQMLLEIGNELIELIGKLILDT